MSDRLYVRSATFSPEDTCFCHSGKSFGACCGSTGPQRPPPAGVMVVKDFLSQDQCETFVRFAEQQKRRRLPAYDVKDAANVAASLTELRKTLTIQLGDMERTLVEWMRRACTEVVQPAFNAKVEWFEMPGVLRYGPGDLYASHADAELVDPQTQRWFRAMNRDFSVLMYFNDDYEGGGLRFDNFNYVYQPSPGDLVFFPSNNVYLHQALPVITGRKYALASWGAIAGTPRVQGVSEARFFL